MEDFLRTLPKAELHVHLEGSVEPETLRELDPSLEIEEIERHYNCQNFAGFLEAFKWVVGFLRSPDDYALVACRLLDRLQAENVRYAEVTLSAGAMVRRGQDFAAVYEAVQREAARSTVEVSWIVDAIRQFGAEHAMEVAKLAVERAGGGVVAFGIGGDEVRGPAEWFSSTFRFAAEHGLRITAHAGETGDADSVWEALEAGADRIGHGIRSAEDPELLAHLRDRDVALEICISSNVATGAVRSFEEHPVRRIFDAGVPVVLNTDDPAMFRTTLTREYELAARSFGFTRSEIEQLAANSFRYAFRTFGG